MINHDEVTTNDAETAKTEVTRCEVPVTIFIHGGVGGGFRGRFLAACCVGLMVFLLTACGGSGTGDSDNSLTGGVSQTRAYYQILDLTTGRAQATGAISDLTTNPDYRSTKMVFRLVSGSGMVGSGSGALGAVLDPSARTVSATAYYLAVFETTQAQWQLLGGGTPWTNLASLNGTDDVRVGGDYPAIGLSSDLVSTVLQTYQGNLGVRLALPSDQQWELACRAGGAGIWSWGSQADSATVTATAVVWEVAGTTRGARTVAGRAANALGFHDMHGNVWELSSGGYLRGGSWNDPLTTARAAHQAPIDPSTRHVLVGARLAYLP